MKIYDRVKVIHMRDEYVEHGVKLNDEGTIIQPEIRDNNFFVVFTDPNFVKEDEFVVIKIEDLQLVEDGGATDKQILEELPLNNPKWWCKVEGGYILNLLGEKKNKIPYDYIKNTLFFCKVNFLL